MTPRSLPGRLRTVLTSLLAVLGLLTTSLLAVGPVTVAEAAASTRPTRTVTVTAAKTGYVWRKSPTQNYNQAKKLFANKSSLATYVGFEPIKLNPGETIQSVKLKLRVTKITGKKKAKLAVVTTGNAWTSESLSYQTRPEKTSTRLNKLKKVKAKKTVTITLNAAKATAALTEGASLQITNTYAKGKVTIARTGKYAPKLVVKIGASTQVNSAQLAATLAATAASGSGVGSAAVGTTNYAVPSNAVYVSPSGTATGTGTKTKPYGSVQAAMNKAATGTTIVLRGGSYHETVEVPYKKALTIQAYPGEAVWFDGASTLTGWKASGSTWATAWNYSFDHRVSLVGGDQTSWWVNPARPMAGYPEQVWINGVEQAQVGSAAQVAAGKFFIDATNKRIVLGTNPTGKKVEASTLQKAIQVHGVGSTLRGFGIRRYGTSVSGTGAISSEVANVTLENLVITDNATMGMKVWNQNAMLRNLTITENGLLGAAFSRATNLSLLNSVIAYNNTEFFNEAPVAGGVKTSWLAKSTIAGNLFRGNHESNGLWLDEGSSDTTIVGNTFIDNGADGLEVEISRRIKVVNNYSINNAWSGIRLYDSSQVEVWNNTVVNNARWSFRIMQDDGRPKMEGNPYVLSDINLRNNVISFASANCPMIVLDQLSKRTGADFKVTLNGNLYQRGATKPTSDICWANGASGVKGFSGLSAFRSATGQDAKSVLLEGATVLTGGYKLNAGTTAATSTVPVPVSGSIAALIGVGDGWKGLGATGKMLAG